MSDSSLAVNGGRKVRSAPWPPRKLIGPEEKAAVVALFDEAISSGDAIGYAGPEEDAYCGEFADFLGGGYADAVSSGTAAVYVALRAVGIEPFTEVVVGAVTDPGGMMPVALLNCVPVVADTTPDSFNTGPDEVEAVITPLTSAILVAHILGEPCDMEGIVRVANKYNIPVVEDCAQAHCATMNGKPLGTFGDVAAFSTMFGKHYCTGGQGGVVFTKNEKLYQQVRWASDRGKPFGLPEGARNQIAAFNFNLGELGAVIGRVQLKKLPEIVRKRREIVAEIARGTSGLKSVAVPDLLPGAEGSYWFLRLKFNADAVTCDKDTFLDAAEAEGLPLVSRNYASNTPHRYEWYTERRVFGTSGYPWTSPAYKGDSSRTFPCPNTLAVDENHFTVSVFESWGDREVADMVEIFRKVEVAYSK